MTSTFAKSLKEQRRIFTPPPRLSLSEFAVNRFRLSAESSAESGAYSFKRAAYQREMLDACSDPLIPTVTFMTGAQMGKSTILLIILSYFVEHDPCPLMMVQPTLDMAQDFSRQRIAPMIRDMGLPIADAKTRDSGNTLLSKSFPGGFLALVGANSPASLSSRPIRVVLFDETDRYQPTAEGSAVELGTARQRTFYNAKTLFVSTPADEDTSEIWQRYLQSDQRRFQHKCPHCKDHFTPVFENIRFSGDAEDAVLVCPHCLESFTETQRLWSISNGKWVTAFPERKDAGFWINSISSPWVTPVEIAQKFLKAKDDPEKLKVWTNTYMAQVWKNHKAKSSDMTVKNVPLIDRVQPMDLDNLPADIWLVTCGVDTQKDRFECTRLGFTPTGKRYVISHDRIYGSPGDYTTRQDLKKHVDTELRTEDGRVIKPILTGVDSGGHFTQAIYDMCRDNFQNGWRSVKGDDGPRPIFPEKASSSAKGTFYIVGVDTVKEHLYHTFNIVDEQAHGYCAFSDDLTPEYFEQLSNEHRVVQYKNGQPVYKWELINSSTHNEALDCHVYAFAVGHAKTKGTRRLSPYELAQALKQQYEAKQARIQMASEEVQTGLEEAQTVETISTPSEPIRTAPNPVKRPRIGVRPGVSSLSMW